MVAIRTENDPATLPLTVTSSICLIQGATKILSLPFYLGPVTPLHSNRLLFNRKSIKSIVVEHLRPSNYAPAGHQQITKKKENALQHI